MTIENPSVLLATFSSGQPVLIAYSRQLHEVEDLLVKTHLPLEPSTTDKLKPLEVEEWQASWQLRPALQEVVRHPGYHGLITDITLSCMEQPVESLYDNVKAKLLPARASIESSVLGFTVKGEMNSTRRHGIGQIERDIWIIRYPAAVAAKKGFWRRVVGEDVAGERSVKSLIKESAAYNGVAAEIKPHGWRP